MEKDPSMVITTKDGEFEATRENTIIFRFLGKLAMYDHIFFVRDMDEGKGTYLFNQNPSYDKIADFMMDNDYPAHINQLRVPECDIQAFDNMIKKEAAEADSGIPESWG